MLFDFCTRMKFYQTIFVFTLGPFCLMAQANQAEKRPEVEKKVTIPQSERKNADIVPNKTPLSDKDIARKKIGWYFTGLPLINFDPVAGIGFGARVYFYDNRDENDALFDYAPYFHRIFVQGFYTTGGRHLHQINWDAPYLFRFLNRWFRARSLFFYESDPTYNYYGVGDESAQAPRFRNGNTLRAPIVNAKDYQSSLDTEGNSVGSTASLYNKVTITRPTLITTTESDLYYIWSGAIRFNLGLNIQYVFVEDRSGDNINVEIEEDDQELKQLDTKLLQDSRAGRIYGFDGSWNNSVRAGISFDNRDFEPDPNRGTLTEFTAEFIPQFLGSRFGFSKYNLSTRIFYDPIPNYEDLVIAVRGSYFFIIGEQAPFYSLNEIFYTNSSFLVNTGGGADSLRGFLSRRFAGRAGAIFNLELRWTFWHFPPAGGQQFSLILAPFIDVGRAFESIEKTHGKDWSLSYGSGFRIAWNQATIINVDFGLSKESFNVYVNFGHIF